MKFQIVVYSVETNNSIAKSEILTSELDAKNVDILASRYLSQWMAEGFAGFKTGDGEYFIISTQAFERVAIRFVIL